MDFEKQNVGLCGPRATGRPVPEYQTPDTQSRREARKEEEGSNEGSEEQEGEGRVATRKGGRTGVGSIRGRHAHSHISPHHSMTDVRGSAESDSADLAAPNLEQRLMTSGHELGVY